MARLVFLLLTTAATSSGAMQTTDDTCHRTTITSAFCHISPQEIMPTQRAVGYSEVNYKMHKSLSGNLSDASTFLEGDGTVRLVVSPEGGLLIIDGHHTAMALYRRQTLFKNLPSDDPAGFLKLRLRAQIACNWHTAFNTTYDFWSMMGKHKYAQISNGSHDESVLDAAHLPVSMPALTNDPWRGLGGIAVKAGGIIDMSCVPFFQFIWADKCFKPYQDDLPSWPKVNQSDYASIMTYVKTKEFATLAHSEKCRDLPGWRAKTGKPAPLPNCTQWSCDVVPPAPSPSVAPAIVPAPPGYDKESDVASWRAAALILAALLCCALGMIVVMYMRQQHKTVHPHKEQLWVQSSQT